MAEDWRVESAAEIAAVMRAADELGRGSAILVANPLPADKQLDPELHDRVLAESLAAAHAAGIRGKDVTPFLLDYFHRATDGASLAVNIDIACNNIRLAADIAAARAA